MIRFGVASNSDSFYSEGYKGTEQAMWWLAKRGLAAFEYSFGRGVSIGEAKREAIRQEALKHNIALSAHAPYYVNLCTDDTEKTKKSFMFIVQSIEALRDFGGNRVVVHIGSASKQARDISFKNAQVNLEALANTLAKSALVSGGADKPSGSSGALPSKAMDNNLLICLETMGKINQFGNLEEVVALCKISPLFIPCIDFGHINARGGGALTIFKGGKLDFSASKDAYKKVLDYVGEQLGESILKKLHIHFSKIMYSKQGEVKHLNFADEIEPTNKDIIFKPYGPCYKPLMHLLKEYKMDKAVVICESKGHQAEDANQMLEYFNSINN
ncbi:MAG: TIM barrel protein [Firmicutes bacterium]|nr:TIM barrel protein [Bacillota bacterium]